MKKRHVPERSCAGCGAKKEKGKLLRFAIKRKEGRILFDERQKIEGRGIYSCPDPKCLGDLEKRARKKKVKQIRGIPLDAVLEALADAKRHAGGEDGKRLTEREGGS
ncbi:MAG: DUF448 domain-containing protein [Deltaproteobacteria bacterium]|nr:MAG: DUF448 domain-containing protein [Deltaproteobacteria bacterium]